MARMQRDAETVPPFSEISGAQRSEVGTCQKSPRQVALAQDSFPGKIGKSEIRVYCTETTELEQIAEIQ